MSERDLDVILKEISLQYADMYHTNTLKIEIDVKKKPESVKLMISNYRNI